MNYQFKIFAFLHITYYTIKIIDMENMNKYKNITQKPIKEIEVLFCPDIIYLLPETYLTRENLMVICIIPYQIVQLIITERERVM